MGRTVDFMVAPVEREIDVPNWFKEYGIKQRGMQLWRRCTEPEMRELVYSTEGKRGRQLRRFFEHRNLQARYYISLRSRNGKFTRPFAMAETEWESMPWVS